MFYEYPLQVSILYQSIKIRHVAYLNNAIINILSHSRNAQKNG